MATLLMGMYFLLQQLALRPYSNFKRSNYSDRTRLCYNIRHKPRLTLSPNYHSIPQAVGVPLENGLVYTSSILGRDQYSEFPPGFYQQCQLVLLYLTQILHRAQSSPDYLLKVNVQITDMVNLSDFLELFDQIFTSNSPFPINTNVVENPFNESLADITTSSGILGQIVQDEEVGDEQTQPSPTSPQPALPPPHQNKPRPALNVIVVDGFFHNDCLIQIDAIACVKIISDPTISIDPFHAPYHLDAEAELKAFREYSLQRWEHVFDSEILDKLEQDDKSTSSHPAIHYARMQIRLELEDKQLVEMNQKAMIRHNTSIDVPILAQYPSVHSVIHIPTGYTYISGCNGLLPNYFDSATNSILSTSQLTTHGPSLPEPRSSTSNTSTTTISSVPPASLSSNLPKSAKEHKLAFSERLEERARASPTQFLTPAVYDLLLIKLMFHEHIFQEVLDIVDQNDAILLKNGKIRAKAAKLAAQAQQTQTPAPPTESRSIQRDDEPAPLAPLLSQPQFPTSNQFTQQCSTELSHKLFTTTYPPVHPNSLSKYAPELHNVIQQRVQEQLQSDDDDDNNNNNNNNNLFLESESNIQSTPPEPTFDPNDDIAKLLNPFYLYTQLLQDYTQAYVETKQSITNLLSISMHSNLNIFTSFVKLTIYTTSTKFLPFIKYAFQLYWPHHPVNSSPSELFSLSIVPVLQLRYDAMVELDAVAIVHKLNQTFLFDYIFATPPRHVSVFNQLFSRLIFQNIYPDDYTKGQGALVPLHMNPTLAKMTHIFERYHKHLSLASSHNDNLSSNHQHLFKLEAKNAGQQAIDEKKLKRRAKERMFKTGAQKSSSSKDSVKTFPNTQTSGEIGTGTGQTYQPLSQHPMVHMALQKLTETKQDDWDEFEASQKSEQFTLQYLNYTYIQLLRQASTLEILPEEYIYTPIYHNPLYIYEKQIQKKADHAHTKEVIDHVIAENPDLVAHPESYDRFDTFDVNSIVRGPLDDKITAAMIEKKSLKLSLKEVQYKNQLQPAHAFRYTVVPTTPTQQQTLYHLTTGLYPLTTDKPQNPFTSTTASFLYSTFVLPFLTAVVGQNSSHTALFSSLFFHSSRSATLSTKLSPFLSLLATLPYLTRNSVLHSLPDMLTDSRQSSSTSTSTSTSSSRDSTTSTNHNKSDESALHEDGPNKHLNKLLNSSIFFRSLQNLILPTVSRTQLHAVPGPKTLTQRIFGQSNSNKVNLEEKWYNFKFDTQYYVPQQMYVKDEHLMLRKQRVEEEQVQMCLVHDIVQLDTEVKPILPDLIDAEYLYDNPKDSTGGHANNDSNQNNKDEDGEQGSGSGVQRKLKDFVHPSEQELEKLAALEAKQKVKEAKLKKKRVKELKQMPQNLQDRGLTRHAAAAGFDSDEESESDSEDDEKGSVWSIFGHGDKNATRSNSPSSSSLPASHRTHFELYAKEHGIPCSPFTAVTIEDKLKYCLKYGQHISDQPTNGLIYSRVGTTPGSIHSSAFIGNNYIHLFATILRLLFLFKQAQNVSIIKVIFITASSSSTSPTHTQSPYLLTQLQEPVTSFFSTRPKSLLSPSFFSPLATPTNPQSIHTRKGTRSRDCGGFMKLFQTHIGARFSHSETSSTSFDQAYNTRLLKQKETLFGALYRRKQLPAITTYAVPQLPNGAKYHIEVQAVFR